MFALVMSRHISLMRISSTSKRSLPLYGPGVVARMQKRRRSSGTSTLIAGFFSVIVLTLILMSFGCVCWYFSFGHVAGYGETGCKITGARREAAMREGEEVLTSRQCFASVHSSSRGCNISAPIMGCGLSTGGSCWASGGIH